MFVPDLGGWRRERMPAWAGQERVRAAPFEAFELELGVLWQDAVLPP